MVFRNLSLFVIMNGGGGGVDRSLHFVCALPPRSPSQFYVEVAEPTACFAFARMLHPRRPLRPARTVPCSKVHSTFSLTVTPFEFDSCHSFVREKKRTTAFYAVVLFFLMVEVARHHPLSRKRRNGLTWQNRCYICHSLNFHNTNNSKNWNLLI